MKDTGQARKKTKDMKRLIEKGMLGNMYIELYNFDKVKKKQIMSEDKSNYIISSGRKRDRELERLKEIRDIEKSQKRIVKWSILMISILLFLLIILIFTELLYPLMSYLLDPLINLLLNSIL